jgi:hypothetical protein
MYKRIMFGESKTASSRGTLSQARSQHAFYAGAHGTLKVLAHMLEHGDVEELHRTIERHGRQLKAMQGLSHRKRRH